MDPRTAQMRRAKGILTRGERVLLRQPDISLRAAEDAFAIFEDYGYPDWWHRAERLRQDALARQRIEGYDF